MNLKELLNPFPKEKTKVYGVISEKEKINPNIYILTIDLISDKMIKFDKEVIYSEKSIQGENPKDNLYLYFMTIETDYDVFVKYFSNQRTDEVYEYELIPSNIYDENIDKDGLECNVYFTASPISEKGYYIKLIRKVFPIPITIPHFKKVPLDNLTDIKNELDSVFTYDMKVNHFKIHNVGQGSCNTILFRSNKRLFYDIGITKYSKKDINYNRYLGNFSRSKFCNYDTVILSHWDEDHFLGLCLDTTGMILRKNWIVPEIGISPNVMRIAYIIDNYGKLIRIANSVSENFYEKDDLVLFKGSGSNKNDSGIILCINNLSKNLVAMGDASYNYARFILNYLNSSGASFKSIDYLVVPHHGAEVDGNIIFDPKVSITMSGYSVYPSDAIISVGYNPKKTYNHPRRNTIVELYNKEFRISRTDKDGRQLIKF